MKRNETMTTGKNNKMVDGYPMYVKDFLLEDLNKFSEIPFCICQTGEEEQILQSSPGRCETAAHPPSSAGLAGSDDHALVQALLGHRNCF